MQGASGKAVDLASRGRSSHTWTMAFARFHTDDLGVDGDPPTQMRQCDHPGCTAAGEHRAPRSRDRLNDYYWFCLDHVREYNKSWNYYEGLSDSEVEALIRHDTIWQRPTWPLGSWAAREETLRRRAQQEYDHGGRPHENDARNGADAFSAHRPQTEEDRALTVLDLSAPVDFATIKARYKALVKRHHPDANGGSREAEEKLKLINRAFGTLKASYAS